MTLEKLAKICGVSIGTVSKAFSGSKEISLKTKEKIFETAKKHGCYEKYAKIKFSKKVVAVIVPEFKSAYYVDIAVYLEEELKNKGFLTLIKCVCANCLDLFAKGYRRQTCTGSKGIFSN